MTWWLWLSLCAVAATATVFFVAWYAAWSWRWKKLWLGLTTEIALALLIVSCGSAAFSVLQIFHP